jgi:hypothetical protein
VAQGDRVGDRLGRALTVAEEPIVPPGAGATAVVGVDLGLRTGVAVLEDVRGVGLRLRRYFSTHYGDRQALRRGAWGLVGTLPRAPLLVVEGDAAYARIWARAASRTGGEVLQVATERWRAALLLPREQRSGGDAKRHAGRKARAVVDWSRAELGDVGPPPVAGDLRHDTAEAILIAVWGALATGRLQPDELPFPLPVG